MFSQEDLQEALAKIEKQRENWEKLTGQTQTKFQARNLIALREEFTQAQFNALLWQWGK